MKISKIANSLLLLLFLQPLVAEVTLISNSPFKSRYADRVSSRPDTAALPTEGEINRRLEFSGIFSVGDKKLFSVYDKNNGKYHWVAAGETVEGFAVESFDEAKSGIIVSYSGRTELVTLKENQALSANSNVSTRSTTFQAAPRLGTYPTPPPMFRPPTLSERLRHEQEVQKQQ